MPRIHAFLCGVVAAVAFAATPIAGADEGITSVASRYSVPETVTRMRHALEQAGMNVSTIEDPDGFAKPARSGRDPSALLFVGDSQQRARLTDANPLLTLDLPIKVLVWNDGGEVKASFHDPDLLASRHALAREEAEYFLKVERLIESALD